MSRTAAKPMFMTTKGQRNQQEDGIYTGHIIDHYRAIAGGTYRYTGTPEDMPEGFIEDTALFFAPGVGCKRVKSLGTVILPIQASTLNVYGRPYDWIAMPLNGMIPIAADSELFAASNDPSLWLGVATRDLIQPYIDIMSNALMTLNTNIDGLNEPIMVSGMPGAELGTLVLSDKLKGKDRIIHTTGNAYKAEVLDLKAQDHTQNLISTIDWCDARILEIMAASNGVEKTSGVSTMETVSGVQSVLQQLQIGLEKRKAWVDAVNDRFRMDMTVEFGEGVKALMQGGQNSAQNDDSEEEVSEDDSE